VVQWRLLLLLHLWLRRSLRCWVVPQQSCKLLRSRDNDCAR
jgi:hypothetical protein